MTTFVVELIHMPTPSSNSSCWCCLLVLQEKGAHVSPIQEACTSNLKGRTLCDLYFLVQLTRQTDKLWMNFLHGLQCQKHRDVVSEGNKLLPHLL